MLVKRRDDGTLGVETEETEDGTVVEDGRIEGRMCVVQSTPYLPTE